MTYTVLSPTVYVELLTVKFFAAGSAWTRLAAARKRIPVKMFAINVEQIVALLVVFMFLSLQFWLFITSAFTNQCDMPGLNPSAGMDF
jgi:hypothetical protein